MKQQLTQNPELEIEKALAERPISPNDVAGDKVKKVVADNHFSNDVRIHPLGLLDGYPSPVFAAEVKLRQTGGKGLNSHGMAIATKMLAVEGYKPVLNAMVECIPVGSTKYMHSYKMLRFSHVEPLEG